MGKPTAKRISRKRLPDRAISKGANVKFGQWKKVMTAQKPPNDNTWKPRSPKQPGFKRGKFSKQKGIYEIATSRKNTTKKIEYLGKSTNLNNRLQDYMRDGSHTKFINKAIRQKKDIHVRIAKTRAPRKVEKLILNHVYYPNNFRR